MRFFDSKMFSVVEEDILQESCRYIGKDCSESTCLKRAQSREATPIYGQEEETYVLEELQANGLDFRRDGGTAEDDLLGLGGLDEDLLNGLTNG